MFGNNSPSLADIAAVTDNRNDGFGGNNGWWILIILFAIFGGWGNGWANSGAGMSTCGRMSNYATQADIQNQTLIGKIDGQTYGIADLGYAINNQANQAEIAAVTRQNSLMTQLSNMQFAQQSDTCAITNAINQAAQNIMANDNANYRSLHDENIALQMSQKDSIIAELKAQVSQLNLAQSQCDQNAYLVSQMQALCAKNNCCGTTSCC